MQTENNQLYEVQWNEKTYASSTTGYLVVPQMPGSNQTLTILFSRETGTKYTFTIEMGNKPRAFSIRQSLNNTWSLFDLVDFSLLQGTPLASLAKTVIISRPNAITPKVVIETKPIDKPTDNPSEPIVVKAEAPQIPKEKPNTKAIGIRKIFDKRSLSGVDQVYVLTIGTRLDTIALFIPVLIGEQPGSDTNPSASTIKSWQSSLVYGNLFLIRPRYTLFSK
ncbi:MAG: hypothetical protein ABIS69_11895 [Sediminibacterium sp.]